MADKKETDASEKSKSQEIFLSYTGTFDPASVEVKKDKNDKDYSVGKLVLSESKSVDIYAFGKNHDTLKEMSGEIQVNGFLIAGGKGMRATSFGGMEREGLVSNVRVSDKEGVEFASAIMSWEADGKKKNSVVKAWSEDSKILAEAEGAQIKVEGSFARDEVVRDGEQSGYRSTIHVNPGKIEITAPAPEAEKEDDSPAP